MPIDKPDLSAIVNEGFTYSTIINEAVDGLSLEAWGLHAYFAGKPRSWVIRETDVRKKFGIGKDKYYRVIRELRAAGLLVDVIERSDEGKIVRRSVVSVSMRGKTTVRETRSKGPQNLTPEKPESGFEGDIKEKDLLEGKDKPTSEPQKGPDTEAIKPYLPLADWMWSKVSPITKQKAYNRSKWADDLRKLIEIDERSEAEVRRIFSAANQDDFWRAVILSPAKLRKQFPALYAKFNGRTASTHDDPFKDAS